MFFCNNLVTRQMRKSPREAEKSADRCPRRSFFFLKRERKKNVINGEDWFTDTRMVLIMYICRLMVCVGVCAQTDLLPLADHWTVAPVLLLMEITGGWGPPPRRHTDLTPPPSPFSTWTRPPPRDYKKSAPAEVVQSRPELHQVREATFTRL